MLKARINKKDALPLLLFLLLAGHTLAQTEAEYTRHIAPKYGVDPNQKTEMDVRLWDGTRVDLLPQQAPFSAYAIEVDWPRKWECIGQACYYADVTGRKPGIILLVRDVRREAASIFRIQTVCARRDIKLWIEVVPKLKGVSVMAPSNTATPYAEPKTASEQSTLDHWHDLLAHCQKVVDQKSKMLTTLRDKLEKSPVSDRPCLRQNIACITELVTKWSAWRDVVADRITELTNDQDRKRPRSDRQPKHQ